MRMMMERWRVGRTVPINVYEGDRPVCQCQTSHDAAMIVHAVNSMFDEANVKISPPVRLDSPLQKAALRVAERFIKGEMSSPERGPTTLQECENALAIIQRAIVDAEVGVWIGAKRKRKIWPWFVMIVGEVIVMLIVFRDQVWP